MKCVFLSLSVQRLTKRGNFVSAQKVAAAEENARFIYCLFSKPAKQCVRGYSTEGRSVASGDLEDFYWAGDSAQWLQRLPVKHKGHEFGPCYQTKNQKTRLLLRM